MAGRERREREQDADVAHGGSERAGTLGTGGAPGETPRWATAGYSRIHARVVDRASEPLAQTRTGADPTAHSRRPAR